MRIYIKSKYLSTYRRILKESKTFLSLYNNWCMVRIYCDDVLLQDRANKYTIKIVFEKYISKEHFTQKNHSASKIGT